MGLILHQIESSPPVRSVRLCLAELQLEAEYRLCRLVDREHLTPEYLEKNPQHTVPTLEDGDFIIWDSHAINGYLVSVYGKNDALYSKDPKMSVMVDGMKSFREEDKQKGREALEFVEKFLMGRKFITGDNFNIADFSVYSSASALVDLLQESAKFPTLKAYINRCQSTFKDGPNDVQRLHGLLKFFQMRMSEG
uniref:Glutathione S-transferase 1 n=1 Tax=Cacopsylla melanoneura TaxID=428564 RepID=A0A8D8V609_9HEMI